MEKCYNIHVYEHEHEPRTRTTFDLVESIQLDSYSFESLSSENVCLTKTENLLKTVSKHFKESTER